MSRKGSTKAKTGCFTCKKRKVRCDEAKPHCQRCTTTNRKCDGYPKLTGQAQYSWAHLLATQTGPAALVQRRMPTGVVGTDEMEARALYFFRLRVAPALSRHSSVSFWEVLVSQMSQREPSVRHALAAISSLYEGLQERLRDSLPMKPSRVRFAITHYNMALGHLKAPETDRNIILLVCLLFICIEAMQENGEMAIQHCRHGILICNNMPTGLSGWAKEELQPIFLRLATFPYFFGMGAGEFPEPVGLAPRPSESETEFDTSDTAWDYLVNRSVRIIRQGLGHRQGPLRSSPIAEALVQDQQQILGSLSCWRQHYRRSSTSLSLGGNDFETHIYREMECIVGQVWVACCIGTSELIYDNHMSAFEDLLSLSRKLIDHRSVDTEPRPIFSFEMGFTPFLYFVVKKCRRLDLRIKALRHMLLVAYDQENLFSTKAMYSVGLRLVELEHGIRLDPALPEAAGASAALMPVDGVRIRNAATTKEKETSIGDTGQVSEYRKVNFLVQPEAVVPGYMEWVEVRPLPSSRL